MCLGGVRARTGCARASSTDSWARGVVEVDARCDGMEMQQTQCQQQESGARKAATDEGGRTGLNGVLRQEGRRILAQIWA